MKLSEMAFAKKTYGGKGIKFIPRKTVYYATIQYGRGGEHAYDGEFSADLLDRMIAAWRKVNEGEKANDMDKLGEGEEEIDEILRDMPGGYQNPAPISEIAEALVTGEGIGTHTRDAVSMEHEELRAAVASTEGAVYKAIFNLLKSR